MSVTAERHGVNGREHAVHFYRDDAELADTVGSHVADALRTGATAVVIATVAHARAFDRVLREGGLDPQAAARSGQLISLDAHSVLAKLTVDGRIDADAFEREVGAPLRLASREGAEIQAYGEMVDLLWQAGDIPAAIELESLWNGLIDELGFPLLCAYHSASVASPELGGALVDVCHLHSSVSSAPGAAVDVHETSRRFEPHELAPASARRFIADVLEQWGRSALSEDASLVLSELVSNGVLHAKSAMSVAIRAAGATIRLSVRDESRAQPIVCPIRPDALSGRGMQIVAALSSSWGVVATPGGKIVWAEL